MKKTEILEAFKRYLKNSALADKDRNLVRDYVLIHEWLLANNGDTNEDLCVMLQLDAEYRTVTKAVTMNIKFKDIAPFGQWDGKAVKDILSIIPKMNNSKSVGDLESYRILEGQLWHKVHQLRKDGCYAAMLYVLQRYMQLNSDTMTAYREIHRCVEELLSCSTDEDIETTFQRNMDSPKKPSPKHHEINIDSADEGR